MVLAAPCVIAVLGVAQALPLPLPPNGAVAVGNEFTVAIQSDGSVWTWGSSAKNVASAAGLPGPARVSDLSNAVAVAMGNAHALVLLSDGTVRTWGSNNFAQVGDGTFVTRLIPIQPSGLGQVTNVAAGFNHCLARKVDGTVWAWGSNDSMQLGDGTFDDQGIPQIVPGLTNVVSIAGGMSASAAVKSDGSVWWWGTLPVNSIARAEAPTAIPSAQNAKDVAVGESHIVILCRDGSVLTLGGNSSGQLGNGGYDENAVAAPVPGISDAVAIVAGSNYSAVLRSDGTVWAWGGNGIGLTGAEVPGTLPSPVAVPGFTDVVAISASKSALIAIRQDGSVISRGGNRYALSGDGFSPLRTKPLQIAGRSDLQAVAACANQVLLLTSEGAVLRPGGEGFALVNGLSSVSAVSLGTTHSLALRSDGTVWSWGNNSYGELGNGTTTFSSVPVQAEGLSGVVRIDGGMYYSSALLADGTVRSWGQNGHSELGDGTTIGRSTPVVTSGAENAIAMAAGYSLAAVVKSDGTVWKWGANGKAMVAGASGVVDLAAGTNHLLALKNNGTVLAMGDNSFGQLGNGSSGGNNSSFISVGGLPAIAKLAGAVSHSLALDNAGHVWAWGKNSRGQLGDGTTTNRLQPVAVPGLSNVISIAAGDAASFAVRDDGRLWAWGDVSSLFDKLGLKVAATRLKPSAADSDQDGVSDAWEMAHYGDLTSRGVSDADNDGLTDVREAALGTDPADADSDADGLPDAVDAFPLDYYNGVGPTLTIVGGDNQVVAPGEFTPLALDVGVWSAAGTSPLVNAPVTFSVSSGGGLLSATVNGVTAPTLALRTDADGTAQAYYQHPSAPGTESVVTVAAGGQEVQFHTFSDAPSEITYDFEVDEGYPVGAVAGHGPWVGDELAVQVSADAAHSGQQALQILPPPEGADHFSVQANFPALPAGRSVRFVDLWIKPAAGATILNLSWLSLSNGPLVAFVGTGATAELHVYENDEGGGVLHRSGRTIAINADGVAAEWHRLTFRLDFSRSRQDIYLDGQPAVGDVRISADNQSFTFYGHTTRSVWLDHVRLLADNPLFTDNDLDGMDDAWETAHGLDPTTNDRRGDSDGDGLRNANEYFVGADPQVSDSDGDGLPDRWEVDYGFNPIVANPPTQDSDQDGVPDRIEFLAGTDPFNTDSDGDRIVDGNEDDDGDGFTAAQEAANGTDPTDFFNGQVPILTPLGDFSAKLGRDGMVAVRVTNPVGTPLANAPVEFNAGSGTLLTANPYGTGRTTMLIVRADAQGIARAYLRPAN